MPSCIACIKITAVFTDVDKYFNLKFSRFLISFEGLCLKPGKSVAENERFRVPNLNEFSSQLQYIYIAGIYISLLRIYGAAIPKISTPLLYSYDNMSVTLTYLEPKQFYLIIFIVDHSSY
jgi:hypothetical protein